MSWRLWSSHLAFKLSEPAVGAPEDFRGAALVAAVFGDGAARDGPFEVVQEPGERSSRLQEIKYARNHFVVRARLAGRVCGGRWGPTAHVAHRVRLFLAYTY